MKKILLFYFLFSFLIPTTLFAQYTLSGIVIDKKTNEPIPFANIAFGDGIRGTVSGLDGRFSVKRSSSELIFRISCLGYETETIEVPVSESFIRVKLIQKDFQLAEVQVFPGENPALTLMKKVYEHRDINDANTACDYKCLIYHKMNFSVDTSSISKRDTIMNDFVSRSHILLIESVSEKKHIAPDKDNERIISSRVSGFEYPIFGALPAQMQSFTFYKDYVTLFDNNYMNPVSKPGLQRYLFLPEDTLIDMRGDTLYYISFRPRQNANIKGMEGTMHIHVPSYGIKTVNAKVSEREFDFWVKQTYQNVDDQQWFPEHLESRLDFKAAAFGGNPSANTPLIYAQSKSSVMNVELNPELSKKEFSAITLIDETYNKNLNMEQFRLPLTAKDSATYQFIDSLVMAYRIDRIYVNLIKAMTEGFIPMGYLKLELDKTIGYNLYEGLKLGLGLWTSDKISDFISVGGFYYRSFKSKDNNYGAGMRMKVNPKWDSDLRFQWEKRNITTGTVKFLDSRVDFLMADLSGYLTKTMDMSNSLHGSFTTRFLKYFKANIFYQYSDVTPTMMYTFLEVKNPTIETNILPKFSHHEYGLKLKWAHKETFTYMYPFGLMSNGTKFPYIWTNISYAEGTEIEKFEYIKLNLQIEQRFHIYEAFKSTIRVTGGYIFGDDVPLSKTFSYFGVNVDELFNIEVPYYFAVMRPNEFAADRYCNIFWRNTFYTRLNSARKFKPDFTFMLSAGFGDIDKNKYDPKYSINSYNKGYYEAGIYAGLLKMLFLKYGVGVHYRFGPYQQQNLIDNMAITIGMGFAL
ncbi:MAG: DUF5686 and carboxypeptidase regulatory-like domain-containing protein [Marinilabiliaceae bacterium]|nr:DUF5686 and carboxypeptidase regulatory-like domain-containing protein [Marinilabiliaceae bacterium]